MAIKKKEDDFFTIKIPRELYGRNVHNIVGFFEHLKRVSKSKASEKSIDSLLLDLKKKRAKKMHGFLTQRGVISK